MFVQIKVCEALEGVAETVLVDRLVFTDSQVSQPSGQLSHDSSSAEHHLPSLFAEEPHCHQSLGQTLLAEEGRVSELSQ